MPIISNFPMGGNTDEIEQLIGEHNKSAEAHKEQFDKQKEYTDAARTITRTVTLTAAGWTDKAQTVTCEGVAADEAKQQIIVMPASKDESAWGAAAVRCVSQAENSLNFICATVPTEDISVYVNITQTAYQLDVTWDTSKEYPFGDITPAEMRAKIEAVGAEDLKSYLPLAGGTMKGDIYLGDATTSISPRSNGGLQMRFASGVSDSSAQVAGGAIELQAKVTPGPKVTYQSYVNLSVNDGVTIGAPNTANKKGVTINNVVDPTADDMAANKKYVDAHSSDKDNPHGVTPAQIGAATAEDLTAHTNNKSNPHGVTAVQIGAAIGTKLLSDDDDLNTLFVSGMYRVAGSTKNCPYSYGQVLVVCGGGDTVAQMSFPYSGDDCKVRWGNPSPLGQGVWTDWTNLITGRTIANQSVNRAKFAGTRDWNSYNLKDEKLTWSEETPTEQGTICWLYQ